MDTNPKFTAKDCIYLANDLIIERNLLIPRLTSLQDINYSLFSLIFEDIFCVDFSELVSIKPKNKSEEIQLMSELLTFFSKQFYDSIPLDHIKAKDIVNRNLDSIHDLLEIISAFVKFIPKDFDDNQNKSLDVKYDAKGVQTGLSSNSSSSDIDLLSVSKQLITEFQKPLKSESSLSLHSSESSPESSIRSFRPSKPLLRQLPITTRIDSEIKERKQEVTKQTDSKAIQTDGQQQTQTLTKTVVSPKDNSFEEYKRLKCENFATLLGYRLHETLKLKQLTEVIEYKIKRYYGDVTTQTPKKITSKSSTKMRTNKKSMIKSKSTPTKRDTTPLKSKTNLNQSYKSLDDLIKAFPEIPRNTIKSLKDQENNQKRVIENLYKDISVKDSKIKSKMSEAVETQQKRSQIIRNDIKHLESLAENKASKMAKIKDIAHKRDSRLERARIHKMLDKYEKDVESKYKRLQSIEENIVLQEYAKREKQQKDRVIDLRKNIREKQESEMNKQKKMLEAFETLYQHKYEMLSESLNEEEKRLKSVISSQSYYLRSLKREMDFKFDRDFQNVFQS